MSRAIVEMIFACQIWGFGFIATVWALESFSPVAMSALRFLLASLFAAPLFLSRSVRQKYLKFDLVQRTFWPGLYLSLTIVLQTWGLKYTTATKSGFLTTLYAVLVPLAECLIWKRRLHKAYSLWILLALVGTAYIVELKWAPLNKGDLLTILCALAATAHILAVGQAAKSITNTFWFNYYQSVWAGALSGLVLIFTPGPHILPVTNMALIGLMWITCMSTMVAFAIQLRAQKVLNPTHAGLIYLLESPFAFIFAVLLLNETLTLWQGFGAALIFLSALGATWSEGRKRSTHVA